MFHWHVFVFLLQGILMSPLIVSGQTALSGPDENGHVYWVTEELTTSFDEASYVCTASGGVLAAIPTLETQTFINEYLTNQ